MLEILVILLVLMFPLGIAYSAVQFTFKSEGGLPAKKAFLLSVLVLSSLALPIFITSTLTIDNPYWIATFFIVCLVGCVLLSGFLIKKLSDSHFSYKNALIVYWGIFWRFVITWVLLGAIIRIAKFFSSAI